MFTVPFNHFSASTTHNETKLKLLPILSDVITLFNLSSTSEEPVTDYFINCKSKKLPIYFDTVKQSLEPCLLQLKDFYKTPDLEIDQMWFQQSTNSQRHSMHTHGVIGLSCIWYLEFDPNHHAGTKFLSPFTDPLRGDTPEKTSVVAEGDLFVFPSFLLHEQCPSFSSQRRTVISFNLKPSGLL